MLATILISVSLLGTVIWCLYSADRAVTTVPLEAERLRQEDWTPAEIDEAYTRAETSPIDVRPYLYAKRNRRYIIVGGSGLVGGWIVRHLLMRGEDPRAIRIVDLSPSKQSDVETIITDITSPEAVSKAFTKSWPDAVKAWPLTVFHTAAYINASERSVDYLSKYKTINIEGTRNILAAAKAADASCFVATSSASIAIQPPSFFPLPWQRKSLFQVWPNAEPKSMNAPLHKFGSCYAWSKAQAEKLVRQANSPPFLTGVIRPGHAIYGHGVENPSSLTWDYLRRGGAPTWLYNVVSNFVCAQNVSIGHLAYENALLEGTNAGGLAYCVTDPNPPIRYGNLYELLERKAATPVSFQQVPHVALLLVAYCMEAYVMLRHRYVPFLLKPDADLMFLQPAVFNMCSLHLVYTDDAAQKEIGYRAPITTLEGFSLAVVDWNRKVAEGKQKQETTATTGAEVMAT